MNPGWKDSTAVHLVSRYTRCSLVPVGYSEVRKRGRIPHHTEEFGSFRVLSVAVAMALVASRGRQVQIPPPLQMKMQPRGPRRKGRRALWTLG